MKKVLGDLSNYFFGAPNKDYKQLSLFYEKFNSNYGNEFTKRSLNNLHSIQIIGKTALTALATTFAYNAFQENLFWLMPILFTESIRECLSDFYHDEIQLRQEDKRREGERSLTIEETVEEIAENWETNPPENPNENPCRDLEDLWDDDDEKDFYE